jgi:hypothetical protein
MSLDRNPKAPYRLNFSRFQKKNTGSLKPPKTEESNWARIAAPSIPLDISPPKLGPSKSYAFETHLSHCHLELPLPSGSTVKIQAILIHDDVPKKPRPQRPTVCCSFLHQSRPPAVLTATGLSFPASMGCPNSPSHSLFPHDSGEETRQRGYALDTLEWKNRTNVSQSTKSWSQSFRARSPWRRA